MENYHKTSGAAASQDSNDLLAIQAEFRRIKEFDRLTKALAEGLVKAKLVDDAAEALTYIIPAFAKCGLLPDYKEDRRPAKDVKGSAVTGIPKHWKEM